MPRGVAHDGRPMWHTSPHATKPFALWSGGSDEAAQESNLPSDGLRRPAGFEDPLGCGSTPSEKETSAPRDSLGDSRESPVRTERGLNLRDPQLVELEAHRSTMRRRGILGHDLGHACGDGANQRRTRRRESPIAARPRSVRRRRSDRHYRAEACPVDLVGEAAVTGHDCVGWCAPPARVNVRRSGNPHLGCGGRAVEPEPHFARHIDPISSHGHWSAVVRRDDLERLEDEPFRPRFACRAFADAPLDDIDDGVCRPGSECRGTASHRPRRTRSRTARPPPPARTALTPEVRGNASHAVSTERMHPCRQSRCRLGATSCARETRG